MKTLTTEEILTLVNLSLIRGEEISDEDLIEFYNHCHGDDGKFCSGSDSGVVSGKADLRDSDGSILTKVNLGDVPRGKLGGSLRDPHEGTQTVEGIRGYDSKGKPVPGTDAYLEAHNIPRKAFESRPYVKYEPSKTDEAINQAYPKGKYEKDKGRNLFLRTAEDTDPEPQTGGYIMYKKPVPGSGHGHIPPQVRPNVPVVTDRGKRAAKLTAYNEAKARLEALKRITPDVLIRDRKLDVVKAQKKLDATLKSSPESIKADMVKRLAEAKTKRSEIRASTNDPIALKEADKQYNKIKKEHDKLVGTKSKPGKADHPKYKEETVYNATQSLKDAQNRLASAQADPEKALKREIVRWGGPDGTGVKTEENKGGLVGRAKKQYDETAAKYLFTPGVTSARIDAGNDPQNIKNLEAMKGNSKSGRIYFAMEGSIKHDAIQTAIKKEDPKAVIVNVPSVTLWQQKDLPAEFPSEVAWFAKTYGKNKDIVLIPDADGVKNNNVMLQAKSLKSSLMQNGAKQVYIATPPLKPGSKQIDKIKLPSGYVDERKGIDDHLGAGRGTLGQLRYETFTDYPKYDLSSHLSSNVKKGEEKISAGGIKNAQKILGAISGIVEDKGVAQIPLKTMSQVADFKESQRTTVRSAMKNLERLGIIKIEWVFDNKSSGTGYRVRNPNMTEDRLDELVKQKIINEPNFDRLSTDKNIEFAPVITILKPEYILKSSNKHTGALSELKTWKPPSTFKGWTSAVTGKPDSTGIAKQQEDNHANFMAKNAVINANRVYTGSTVAKAPTAKQRLAAKKAPTGKKLVRTAEGAKRYGVAIGQEIPFSLTNMVLLSSLMTEDELSEFYNRCHDDSGRFCEGDRGGGAVSGKFDSGGVKTVAKSTFGSVSVDGIKAKAVYEIVTKDGKNIRLYDKAGNAGKYKNDLLGTQAKMHNLYPMHPPRDIIIANPLRGSMMGKNTFAMVLGSQPYTYVNSQKLGLDVGKYRDGFQMPSAKTGRTNDMSYLMMHEYGHHVDFNKHSAGGYHYKTHPLYKNPSFTKHLSTYGKTDPHGIEAYAETFAEWNHSKGKTKNPAAIAMARYEGWPGANELRGSIGEVNLTLLNAIHCADEGIKAFPDDTEDDINADIPSVGKGITAVDSETGPEIVGDYETTQPSEGEIARADKILREVYKELGLDYQEGATTNA